MQPSTRAPYCLLTYSKAWAASGYASQLTPRQVLCQFAFRVCHFEKPFQPIRVFLLIANGSQLWRLPFSRQNCVQSREANRISPQRLQGYTINTALVYIFDRFTCCQMPQHWPWKLLDSWIVELWHCCELSYALQIIDSINGSAELRQLLTCGEVLCRVTPIKSVNQPLQFYISIYIYII